MIAYDPAAVAGFVPTWRIVGREVRLLRRTAERLFAEAIDAAWVERLAYDDERSERVEAFAARYSRLQDTLGDRLFPRLLALVGQQGATLIDRLNQLEKLSLLNDAQAWLAWRNPRNRLVHEYVEDPDEFADALLVAQRYAASLCEVVDRIEDWLRELGVADAIAAC